MHRKLIRGLHAASRLALAAVIALSIPCPAAAQKQLAKRALIISIDGLDSRYIQEPDKYGLRIPTLRKLMSDGVASEGVRPVFPSVTFPNHASMVTGARPITHGIVGNGKFEDPSGPRPGNWYWWSDDIRTDTLWGAASRNGMTVGVVSWPVSTGAGDWNVPLVWAPGGSLADSRKRVAENARPRGLVDEIDRATNGVYSNSTEEEGDDATTRFSEYIITRKRPGLMLVHLADLDQFEHKYGPFTKEAIEILEKSDGYVDRILKAYKEAGILDETAVFITSDHGFKPVSRDINPGVLLAKEGLVSLETSRDGEGNERPLVKDWKAAVYANAAYCAIYVSDWKEKTILGKVRKMFKDIEGKQGFGIHRIYDPEEVRSIGGDPKAALVLDPADGYSCGGAYTGEYITNAVYKGNHGYHPDRPDFMASFIASGAGVSVRGSIGIINIYDVGPTVAKLLGFEISDAEGKPFELGRR